MVLQLDPRVPVVWRDPTTLQFGVARVLAVVPDVGTAVERMVAALGAGISPSGLVMTGKAAGATETEVAEFLARVRPALARVRGDRAPVVVIVGGGPTVERLAEALGAAGVRVRLAASAVEAADEPCDLGVVVARYVIAPELHSIWLRRDVPHLAVVLADAELTVGPVVEPGRGACLHCLHRYRVESDRAWPAIATQLLARPLPVESPLVADEAAAAAARMVLDRLLVVDRAEARPATGTAVTIATRTGERRLEEWPPHPDCGCIELGAVSAPSRPGTGSRDDGRRAARTPAGPTPPPTRSTIAAAPA